MIDYAEIDALLRDIIPQVGRTFTVSRVNEAGVVSSVNFVGLQVDKVLEEMPGSNVEIGDWRLFITSAVEPKIGDLTVLSEGRHRVVRFDEINPAGVNLAYWVWMRRG